MGLIGWADAPNSLDSNEGVAGGIPNASAAPVFAHAVEKFLDENSQDNTAESPFGDEDDGFEFVDEKSISKPVVMGEDWDDDYDDAEEREAAEELLNAIRGLKLSKDEQNPVSRYDISKFELHEVKFLFDHAERCGFEDYFAAVKEVFGVKHRILDEGLNIDSIESPNLDELLAFVETKYEKAFSEDED